MIVKEAEYEQCGDCEQRRLVADAVRGCDHCEDVIDDVEQTLLEVTAFNHGGDCTDYHFCSWACVFEALPKIECDDFLSLPFLHYKDVTRGCNAQSFFGEIFRLDYIGK